MRDLHSRHLRHIAALTILLLSAGASAAAAQAAPPVMDAYWREILQGEGYSTPVTSPSGALRDNAVQGFSVSMSQGTEYAFFAMCDEDCDDVDIIVIGPDGQELAADRDTDDAPTVRVRAAATGTHTLRISMASCTAEPCRFWARGYSKPRPTSTAGALGAGVSGAGRRCTVTNSSLSIAQGESVSGSLGARDCRRDDDSYARYYRLELASRDSVTITMSSDAFDAYLVLEDSRGTDVESDDDGAGGTNARIDRVLPAGTYYVIANSLGSDESGAFRLQVSSRRFASTTGTTGTTTAGTIGASAPASSRTIDLSQHSAWHTGTSASGRCAYSYSDGGYRIDILSPATCYPARTASAGVNETFTGDNMRLSVTFRSISGTNVRPGISFGNESDGSKYVFSMSTSGAVRLSRWNGGTSTWTNILGNFTSRYANTGLGATNMLSVELEGTQVRMFVNGNLVSRRTLSAPPARNFTASLQGGSAVFQRLDVRPVATSGSGW